MWIITISGWIFFKVEFTQQGIPYPTKEIKGNIQQGEFKN